MRGVFVEALWGAQAAALYFAAACAASLFYIATRIGLTRDSLLPAAGSVTEDLSRSSRVEDRFVDVFAGFRQPVLNRSNDQATLSLLRKLCPFLSDPRWELPDSPLRQRH